MSTPLSIHRAAERYVTASARLHPDKLEEISQKQHDRVVEEVGHLDFDHDGATELLEALADEGSPFSEEQRTSSSEVILHVQDGCFEEAVLRNKNMR